MYVSADRIPDLLAFVTAGTAGTRGKVWWILPVLPFFRGHVMRIYSQNGQYIVLPLISPCYEYCQH